MKSKVRSDEKKKEKERDVRIEEREGEGREVGNGMWGGGTNMGEPG